MLHFRKNGLLSRSPKNSSFLENAGATPEWVTQDYGETLEMENGWTLLSSGESDSGVPIGIAFYRQWEDGYTEDGISIHIKTTAGDIPAILQEFTQATSKAVVHPFFIPMKGKDVDLYVGYYQKAPSDVGFIPTTVSLSLFGRSYALHFASESSQIVCTISQDGKGHIFLDGEDVGFFPYYVFPDWLVLK